MAVSHRFTYATLPKTQRGNPLVLGGDPKGENFLYTHGNSVIIRNIENPAISDVYTEHSTQALVAKYSPSRYYIASADIAGKIRIWDTVNREHILKNEFQPFAGPIKDLAWSPDNQRIVVVGEGRERFGHVFMAETGTSVGEVSGQSRVLNTCDYRPIRPFRIITGSEDNSVGIFEGPPFKFKMTKKEHTNFVQAVRFSPNGELFASAGFDGKVLIYCAKTYDLVSELGSPAHKGGVYAVSWSPDGKQLLTASGDKTSKIWDVETKTATVDFVMGKEIDDQQVSCLWQGKYLLSVSLSGFINYLDPNNPFKHIRVVKGHNKPITVMTCSYNHDKLYTGSHDGFITEWEVSTGTNERINGKGHGNQINGMSATKETLFTAGIDDSLRFIDLESKTYKDQFTKLASQPRGMGIMDSDTAIVGSVSEIAVIKNGTKVSSLPVDYEPSCVSCDSGSKHVAVGGTTDSKVHIYELSESNTLIHKTDVSHLGAITDVEYAPNGKYLAASDANRRIWVYCLPDYQLAHNNEWGFHNARVNCVAWSPDSVHVASGSLDTGIIVWSMNHPSKHVQIKCAHPQSQITKLCWLDNKKFVSVGQDSNTKIWELETCP